MRVLVTGSAGFIGFHLCRALLSRSIDVLGIDNLNTYYDVNLKLDRNKVLVAESQDFPGNYNFMQGDLCDKSFVSQAFDDFSPDVIVNLAAQAGVRYSITNPEAYINSNILGFSNLIQASVTADVQNFIYASSSSVYGGNKTSPFCESHSVNHPVSLYAATKKSNELIAHSFSHIHGLPTTGLRFFTVYGPWGRPDMALFRFTKNILEGRPIDVYNHGNMIRDFTYIDDVVEAISLLIHKPARPNALFDPATPDPSSSWAPYNIFNVGNGNPISLTRYIQAIEDCLGLSAVINYMPIQPGDVPSTEANTANLANWINFSPSTTVEVGISRFVSWYKDYYSIT